MKEGLCYEQCGLSAETDKKAGPVGIYYKTFGVWNPRGQAGLTHAPCHAWPVVLWALGTDPMVGVGGPETGRDFGQKRSPLTWVV